VKKNILTVEGRCDALGRFLTKYCEHLGDGAVAPDIKPVGTMPLARIKRLHLLFVLNDIAHHLKHTKKPGTRENFTKAMMTHLPGMFQHIVDSGGRKVPKHAAKLKDLLECWREKELFPSKLISRLGFILDPNDITDDMDIDDEPKDPIWDMPATLGTRSLPWHEQPGGSWFNAIHEDDYLRPKDLKVANLPKGKVQPDLQAAVETLLSDVKRRHDDTFHFSKPEDKAWFDEIGQLAYNKNQGMTYYGWSRAFVKKAWKKRGLRSSRSSRRRF
jgi:CID domain